MMENAIYSVISPEGCAAILWKDPERAYAATEEAAARMRVTAPEHLRNGLIDEIVPEPPGGAHADHDAAAALLGERLRLALRDVSKRSPADRREARYRKFRSMGNFGLEEAPSRIAQDPPARVDQGAAGRDAAGHRPGSTG